MQRRRKTRKPWPSASAVTAGRQRAIHADIGNPPQAKAFVDAAIKELGRLDILVNSAGGKRI
jgi:NAD(P)-dependent dehydrogenase (short-subunit alcohol dehydrogenase family)